MSYALMLAVCINLCSLSIWCCNVVCPSSGHASAEIWRCHARHFEERFQ